MSIVESLGMLAHQKRSLNLASCHGVQTHKGPSLFRPRKPSTLRVGLKVQQRIAVQVRSTFSGKLPGLAGLTVAGARGWAQPSQCPSGGALTVGRKAEASGKNRRHETTDMGSLPFPACCGLQRIVWVVFPGACSRGLTQSSGMTAAIIRELSQQRHVMSRSRNTHDQIRKPLVSQESPPGLSECQHTLSLTDGPRAIQFVSVMACGNCIETVRSALPTGDMILVQPAVRTIKWGMVALEAPLVAPPHSTPFSTVQTLGMSRTTCPAELGSRKDHLCFKTLVAPLASFEEAKGSRRLGRGFFWGHQDMLLASDC